ncbi:hypothetical protein ACHAWO_012061 [Cyclotella atomus]|uniref:Uncharacterized protein n=1 Tax=Cyclotella atomus TaxID=382360 RepID=A0ABD3PT21_9STRA
MSDNYNDKTKYVPWNPSCGMSANRWDRMERNRVAAYEKKIANARIAEWKKNMQRHSFPPPFGSAPYIPPAPPAWTQQRQPPFAAVLPPANPYRPSHKPPPLANITNTHRASPESSPPKKKTAVAVSSVSAIDQFVPSNLDATGLCGEVTSASADEVKSDPAEVKSGDTTGEDSKCPPPRDYMDFQYTYHKTLKNNVDRFRCLCHRNKDCKGCNAVLKVRSNSDGTETIELTGKHVEACIARNGRQVAVSESFTDLRVQMKQFVEARATHEEHRGDTPEQIWAATVKHFREIAGQTLWFYGHFWLRNASLHCQFMNPSYLGLYQAV